MERSNKYIRTIIPNIYGIALAFLLMSLKYGLWGGIISAIVLGVMYMLFAALIFIPFDYIYTRNLPPEAINLNQEREIQTQGNLEHVFNTCVDVLKNIGVIKKVMPDKDKMIISAKTKGSMASFGEKIKLQFILLAGNIIKIHIESKPSDNWALLDYGKNFKNVEMISKAIENKIGGS
ncbi:MAG: hypothetical protein HZB81_00775 [Deltaproteobacteria bacterium]|nr:hypothetical protein [Deltaproteobacteria bacterium]